MNFDLELSILEHKPIHHFFGNESVNILIEASDILKQDFELGGQVLICKFASLVQYLVDAVVWLDHHAHDTLVEGSY